MGALAGEEAGGLEPKDGGWRICQRLENALGVELVL